MKDNKQENKLEKEHTGKSLEYLNFDRFFIYVNATSVSLIIKVIYPHVVKPGWNYTGIFRIL